MNKLPVDASKVTRVEEWRREPDDEELLSMMLECEEYLGRYHWCERIVDRYFGIGIPGIFCIGLFHIVPSRANIEDYLWVVTGDIPPTYFDTDDTPNPACALCVYIYIMRMWVKAVEQSEDVSGLFPVNVPPTREWAAELRIRLDSLHEILEMEWKSDIGSCPYYHERTPSPDAGPAVKRTRDSNRFLKSARSRLGWAFSKALGQRNGGLAVALVRREALASGESARRKDPVDSDQSYIQNAKVTAIEQFEAETPEDTRCMQEMARLSETRLLEQGDIRKVVATYVGGGISEIICVSLHQVSRSDKEVRLVWCIVGEIPFLHMEAPGITDHLEAVQHYIHQCAAWCTFVLDDIGEKGTMSWALPPRPVIARDLRQRLPMLQNLLLPAMRSRYFIDQNAREFFDLWWDNVEDSWMDL